MMKFAFNWNSAKRVNHEKISAISMAERKDETKCY